MKITVHAYKVARRLLGEGTPVDVVYEAANAVECPACGAQPGEWCEEPGGDFYLCPARFGKYYTYV